MRKAVSPPKKTGQNHGQVQIQNAYQNSSPPQPSPQNQSSGPVAAQATQMLVKRQLNFTQEQLLELQRAGRFGKQPVPQEYAVIPPQTPEFKGRKTLVLDLDETLIHSKFSEAHLRACRTRGRCDFQMRIQVEGRPIQVYVLIRPGVLFFLQKLASIYEIVLYTASMSIYANPLVDTLDQDELIPMRLYREHCFSFTGSYIKDLSLLGRDMKDVIIVDNSPNAYFFHNENAVPILSWYDDPDDRCLFEMIPLLEALSQVHDVRTLIPKFVKKDISLVDFPKAAWVLNDAYRKMHQQNEKNSTEAPSPTINDAIKNSKQALSPVQKQQQQTPQKGKPKLDDAYERKPSPINLKPLSPLAAKDAATTEAGSKPGTNRKERTFSPRQMKISSKQQMEAAGEDAADPAAAEAKNVNAKKRRGESSNDVVKKNSSNVVPLREEKEDEIAQVENRRQRKRMSNVGNENNDQGELDDAGTNKNAKQTASTNNENRTKTQDTQELAKEQNENNQLYQKVSQRKQQIMTRPGQSQPTIGAIRRKQSAQKNAGESNVADESSRLSSKNTSFSQNRGAAVQLEINTNKAELASGPLVDLPPHLQKIMQARSTTNKTSSMARQQIVIPQSNIITPVNGKLGNSHRTGTSNGLGKGEAGSLNATFQNMPKSNNLFQTSPTEAQPDPDIALHQQKQPSSTTNTKENLNKSFSNQGAVINNNSNQSSTTWTSRQQMGGLNKSGGTQGQQPRGESGQIMQHSSRLNGRRKLSRNDASAVANQPQINVQGNLSIRRGITRYHQAASQSRGTDSHNISGVMSSRNESQNVGNVKLIGKNSLHMKRRSEYPAEATANSNQWHLPDTKNSAATGIITSESQKSTGPGSFSFQKHQQAAPNAAWPPGQTNGSGVQHSQSQGGVSQSSNNQKRVINQSVGQLTNVKHINSAQLANVPASTGHKKVQSLLSNIQNRDNGRQIHIMQPGISTQQPGLNTSAIGSQSSSTRHRKPPMLVRNNPQQQQRVGVSQMPGTQPNSTTNREGRRDQWVNFANIMNYNGPGSPTNATGAASADHVTPMGKAGQNKLSSDFIVKNGSTSVGANGVPTAQQKQNFLNLIQTQPVAGGLSGKAKFKQAKPLTSTRGKSVPQERPSNSQGNANGGNQSLTNVTAIQAAGVGQGSNSATKSSTGIRISSQRQQFISSSNKTIKTLKAFGQGGRQGQQPQTGETRPQKGHQ